MGRTLLALSHWRRSDPRQRLTVPAAASADFLLRFPVALERLYASRDRELTTAARPGVSERRSPENDHLEAQLALWTTRHRLVVGALVGRRLVRLTPAVSTSALVVTPAGRSAATSLRAAQGWAPLDRRAQALGALGLAPRTLVQACHDAIVGERVTR
jgi:hypothetical protein